jgi:uncharacterized protein (UPF0335 family)
LPPARRVEPAGAGGYGPAPCEAATRVGPAGYGTLFPGVDERMTDVGGVAADRLKSFIERIERLEEERTAIGADIREIYAEAKGTGFDTKIMRQVIKLRKMDHADRQEQEHLLDLYKRALGIEE